MDDIETSGINADVKRLSDRIYQSSAVLAPPVTQSGESAIGIAALTPLAALCHRPLGAVSAIETELESRSGR